MWDSRSKGLHAHLVPAKGIDFEGFEAVVKLLAADLDRLGYKRVVFRSDTERSIVALPREVRKYWSGEVVPETASTGDPQSNGAAEAAVRVFKNSVRTLKDALEHNLSSTSTAARIPPTSGLMSLLVRQESAVQRLCSVG